MEKQSIYQRLAQAQGDFPAIEKNADNPFFKSKYATLDQIQKAIQPVLAKNGLGYIQTFVEGGLLTTLFSIEGEKLESGVHPMTFSTKPQDNGSMITYAKRYSLASFLGVIVAGEDDDGNDAQKKSMTPPVGNFGAKPEVKRWYPKKYQSQEPSDSGILVLEALKKGSTQKQIIERLSKEYAMDKYGIAWIEEQAKKIRDEQEPVVQIDDDVDDINVDEVPF